MIMITLSEIESLFSLVKAVENAAVAFEAAKAAETNPVGFVQKAENALDEAKAAVTAFFDTLYPTSTSTTSTTS
jgi:hypothetical protein